MRELENHRGKSGVVKRSEATDHVWVRDNNNLIQEWSQVPMLVVFPGDEDDMMFMTKLTPNSQVISKRRKHPNLYNTDNTGPRKTRTNSLIDTREMGESARERDLHQKAVAPISRQPTSRALSGLGVSSKPRPRSVRNKTVPFRRVQNRLLISGPLLTDTSIDSVLYC